jgi:hypothetical protein
MKSNWIEHQGKRIFFADYSGFGDDSLALHREVEAAIEAIAVEPVKSVLVLVNFEGTHPSIANLNVVRKLVPRANLAVIRRALLGLSGSSRFFITTFANVTGGTPMVAFESREKALEWLIGA